MRTFLKSVSQGKIGLTMVISAMVAYQIGSYLDNGNIDRVLKAGQPLYMNTAPEMTMVISVTIGLFGLLLMIGSWEPKH